MNNEIIPGFDDTDPSLLPEHSTSWSPLNIRLEKLPYLDDFLVLDLEGELNAITGVLLGQKLVKIVDHGYKNLILNLSDVHLGDYREVLVLPLQKSLRSVGGTLAMVCPPTSLVDYYKLSFGEEFALVLGELVVAMSVRAAIAKFLGQHSDFWNDGTKKTVSFKT